MHGAAGYSSSALSVHGSKRVRVMLLQGPCCLSVLPLCCLTAATVIHAAAPLLQVLSQHPSAAEVASDTRCITSFQEGLRACLTRVLQIQVSGGRAGSLPASASPA
jgi:hypothetical protein